MELVYSTGGREKYKKYEQTAKNIKYYRKSNELWQRYIDIMIEHDCDDVFMDVLSKILYISGRGQAVSECIFAIDESNYYVEK